MLGVADNVWLQPHRLTLLGMSIGRNVTVIRLDSGELIVHSTAPFSAEEVAGISALGTPAWLVEATNFHDTFASPGVAAFPDLPYLAPPGFRAPKGCRVLPLASPPDAWGNEIEVIPIGGMPKVNEHALFHRSSKTMIVADLLFNLSPAGGPWTRVGMRAVSGIRDYPGNSRLFRAMIRDRSAFEESLKEFLSLDFDRLVVAHGDPLLRDARGRAASVFRDLGYEV